MVPRVGALPLLAATASAHSVLFSVGDWGTATISDHFGKSEAAVAAAMGGEAEAPLAVLNTGDNFYSCGMTGNDARDKLIFQVDFLDTFGKHRLLDHAPWIAALGNHDYAGKPDAQTTSVASWDARWVMPARHFAHRVALNGADGHATVVVLDTNACNADYLSDDAARWDPCQDYRPCRGAQAGDPQCAVHENAVAAAPCARQMEWLTEQVQSAPAGDWVLVMGHHPAHEVTDGKGATLASALAKADRRVDLYLNGHTHILEQYSDASMPSVSALVTSGAGGYTHLPHSQTDGRSDSHDPGSRDAQCAAADEADAPLLAHRSALAEDAGVCGRRDGNRHAGSGTSLFKSKLPGYTVLTFEGDSMRMDFKSYAREVLHSFTVARGKGIVGADEEVVA